MRWTEEEHMSFLYGLEICGEENWKDISQLFVLSKNPTQVASHAQKYFQHKNTPKKVRKRRSIHDTTSEETELNWIELRLRHWKSEVMELHCSVKKLENEKGELSSNQRKKRNHEMTQCLVSSRFFRKQWRHDDGDFLSWDFFFGWFLVWCFSLNYRICSRNG